MRRSIGLALSTLCVVSACGRPRPVVSPVAERCFPVETLSAEDRRWADQLLLTAADGEALYTMAGGLKPTSSDGGTLQLRVFPTVDAAALDSLDRLRRIAAVLHCGAVEATVALFAQPYARGTDSIRIADLVFVHREAVRRAVARQREFFATLGITPATPATQVVAAVESAPRAPRWRGYGYLFGYPDDAVDFFVRAGIHGDSTRTLVPRDFRRITTWRKYPAVRGGPPTESAFVYAVPKGAPMSAGDSALAQAAAPIFAEYAAARARLGSDTAAIIGLLRGWERVRQ